mgnify:CR=1 FL=1
MLPLTAGWFGLILHWTRKGFLINPLLSTSNFSHDLERAFSNRLTLQSSETGVFPHHPEG